MTSDLTMENSSKLSDIIAHVVKLDLWSQSGIMTALGSIIIIDPFDETHQSSQCYVERFEHYFKVNEIDAGN